MSSDRSLSINSSAFAALVFAATLVLFGHNDAGDAGMGPGHRQLCPVARRRRRQCKHPTQAVGSAQ
jgi:hypothetical protein